jgi:hypothetical protein
MFASCINQPNYWVVAQFRVQALACLPKQQPKG